MQLKQTGRQPLVSVIVPVYRIENYVDRCISSIRQQTYHKLEIILINDGSPDHSIQICSSHAKEDERITVIDQENKGLSAARNEGIRLAHGEYLTFVDGDDWIDPEMIGKMVDAVDRNDAQICCCGYARDSENQTKSFVPREECLSAEAAVGEWLRNRNIKMMAWGKLYARELFTEDMFFPVGRCFEDTAACWKLFVRSRKVAVISEALYHYCIRGESISNSHSKRNIVDRWYAVHTVYQLLGSQNKEFEKLTVRMCFSCVEYAWHERSKFSKAEQLEMNETYQEMTEFSKAHIKECRKCGCNLLEWSIAICACVKAPCCMCNLLYKFSRIGKARPSKRAK